MAVTASMADVEVRILCREERGYPVEMTLNLEREFPRGWMSSAVLGLPHEGSEKLPERLFNALFADPVLARAWGEIGARAPRRRIRLRIDDNAPELNALPWELLREPVDIHAGRDLAACVDTPFSRYLASVALPGGPVRERPLRVLVAIADPGDLVRFRAEIHRSKENDAVARVAEQCGHDVVFTELAKPCTLPRLEAALAEGNFHILHFVGHGAFSESAGHSVLLLEDEEVPDKVRRVPEMEIGEAFKRAVSRSSQQGESALRLVVLLSCETARLCPDSAFRGMVPQLVSAGVPAVVAMQDLVPQQTARAFMEAFYPRLFEHGQVDLAVNEARSAVLALRQPAGLSRGLAAHALPCLFMRLREGRLFDRSESRDATDEHALAMAVRRHHDLLMRGEAADEAEEEIRTLRGDMRRADLLLPHDFLADERYQLLVRLDSRGETDVWKAFDYNERVAVAIKVLRDGVANRASASLRLAHEVNVAAALDHPGIARVLEPLRNCSGIDFAVLELAAGGSLAEAINSGELSKLEAMKTLVEAGTALSYAHASNHIHGAISPYSILFNVDGAVKLIGFNGTGGSPRADAERPGESLCVYAAPEALSGERQADARSDVYSLGMNALFCLVGQSPTLEDLSSVRRLLDRTPVTESIRAVVERAIQQDPSARFPSASAFCKALSEALQTAETAVAGRGIQRFVGRERQLAQMDAWFAQVEQGHAQLTFVAGEEGAGKTALLEAFARRLLNTATTAAIASSRCSAQTGGGDPYAPFMEIFTLLTGGEAGGSACAHGVLGNTRTWRTRRQMSAALKLMVEVAPDLIGTVVPVARLVARVSSLTCGAERWATELRRRLQREWEQDDRVERAELFRQCTELLSALSQIQPLVIIVEDLQWADTTSLDLILHLAERLKDERVLFIGTYREHKLVVEHGAQPHPFTRILAEIKRDRGDIEIDLQAIDENERRTFTSQLVDTEPNQLGPEFRNALFRHTAGHALFTLEVLRALRQRGEMVRDAEKRWLDPTLSELPQVDAIIGEQVERLDGNHRDLLEAAAVEGRDFTAQVVGLLQKVNEREVLKSLSRELEKRHNLVRGGRTARPGRAVLSQYHFSSGLLQQYVYQNVPEATRIRLHAEVAAALEDLYKDRTDEISLQLAHHHEMSGNAAQAVKHLLCVAQRALRVSAYAQACEVLVRAHTLLHSLPRDAARDHCELTICVRLATTWRVTKGWASASAKAQYDRAVELSRVVDDSPLSSSALLGIWAFYLVRVELETADEMARKLWELSQKTGDRGIQSAARVALLNTAFWRGDLSVTCNEAVELSRVYDPAAFHDYRMHYGQDPLVIAQMMQSWATWLQGDPDMAVSTADASVALAERLEHPFSLAIALTTRAWLAQHMRDLPVATQAAERLIKLAQQHSFLAYEGLGLMLRGWATAQRGSGAEAAEIERGFTAWSQTSGDLTTTFFCVLLAEAQRAAGCMDEALATTERGLDVANVKGERPYVPELLRQKAECLAANPLRRTEAAGWFRQALEAAKQWNEPMLGLRAAAGLFELSLSDAPCADARLELAAACELVKGGLELAAARQLLSRANDHLDMDTHPAITSKE